MKTRLLFRAFTALGFFALFVSPTSAGYGQATNENQAPPPLRASATNAPIRYTVEIANESLSLEPIKDLVDVNAIWGRQIVKTTHMPLTNVTFRVPATVDNLARYLQAINPELNIVLSPGTEGVRIKYLKLRSAEMNELVQAVGFATEGEIRGSSFSGNHNWTFLSRSRKTERTVEVFNLSGFIQHLGKPEHREQVINEKLDEIQMIIMETLHEVKQGALSSGESPNFKFHQGTGLFIVTGSPAAIEVARKVINALPGQSSAVQPSLDALNEAVKK